MKQISQEEFEQSIQDIIDGKCTRVELQKRYHVDRVTLNNKIQELYVYNIDLYMAFIRKFPYKPREYTHINYRAMVIDIMKKGYNKRQLADQYEISDRTIARKINMLAETEPELISLYRRVAKYRKSQKRLPKDLQSEVDALPMEEIFLGGVIDKREQELMEKEKQYTETRMQGISDAKAYGTKKTVKDLSTLYRIKLEARAKSSEAQSTSIGEKQREEERE